MKPKMVICKRRPKLCGRKRNTASTLFGYPETCAWISQHPKTMSNLVMCELSRSNMSVAGGTKMILLYEKVAKDNMQVRFSKEEDGKVL
ncbi:embryonic polarity protein dorsal-like [Bombus fervidus]|uniref:embryonic polarity protein dorsal-like n=1 Tax=Bombus fervidus TaxID=203811 RepID=UPI003AB7FCBC